MLPGLKIQTLELKEKGKQCIWLVLDLSMFVVLDTCYMDQKREIALWEIGLQLLHVWVISKITFFEVHLAINWKEF